MSYNIGPRIGIEGEEEYRKSLKEINTGIQTLGTEMKAVTSEFIGQEKSVESLSAENDVLDRTISSLNEKLELQKRMLRESANAYGEANEKTQKWQQAVNETTAELNKAKAKITENEKAIDNLGDETDEAAKSTSVFSDTLKNAFVGGAIVGAVKGIADAVVNLVDSTEDYRRIMGTLETSSEKAGYATDQTKEAYSRLYEVLGDSQSAATTVANLQAIGLAQGDLMKLIDLCTGAWATYGDSIPIDGLSEAINETIQTGKVTGVFADVLNWAGISEDEFNGKLAETPGKADRARIVLEQMKKQGLDETAQAWRDNNEAIVNMHQAQDEWEQATGKLGEALAPAVAYIRGEFAAALNWVADAVTKAIGLIDQLNQKKIGTNLPSTQPGNYSNITGKYFDPDEEYYGTSNSYLDDLKSGRTGSSQSTTARTGSVSNSGTGTQVIEVHTTMQLDRQTVGEAVTQYQVQEARKKG